MVEDTNVTITEESIDVTLSNISFDAHSTTHQNGGTDVIDLDKLNVAGDVTLDGNNLTDVRSTGDTVVVSGTEYEIQKDGTDGVGVINFKTQ